jgi:tRNA-splicing ligase RtcB
MTKRYKIYADLAYVDQAAMSQFYDAMKLEYAVQGAVMPDVHKGYALPIGSVVATKGVVVPAWVGYDIGCGMCAVKTTFKKKFIEAHKDIIFKRIYEEIPVGFNHNTDDSKWDWESIPHTSFMNKLFRHDGLKQLGSLGGGNHFIEIGHDITEDENIWIIIHSGSRGIGHKCATQYMNKACTGQNKEWHYPLHVDTDDGKDYITDLNFCLEFALQNREEMINRVIKVIRHYATGRDIKESFINRNHNHAELKDGLWIHRKGATHAEEGMMGVIPGNMRDGSFIVEGLGNPDSLYSSSHGAGRVFGRAEAKQRISMDMFRESMAGITAKVEASTIDESPMAYKDIYDVMDMQKDLVKVITQVKPIINIKA